MGPITLWRWRLGSWTATVVIVWVAALLSLSGCGQVRLAPDYSADLVKKVSTLRDAVLQFARDERRNYATDKGRYPANEATYDTWFAQVEGMTQDSALLEPGIDCAPIAKTFQALVQRAGGLGKIIELASSKGDFQSKYLDMEADMKKRGCQTQMFFDLQAQIIHMATEHKMDDDELATNATLRSLQQAVKTAHSEAERRAASAAVAAFYARRATVLWGPSLVGGVVQIGTYPLMIGGVMGSIDALQPVLAVKKPQ